MRGRHESVKGRGGLSSITSVRLRVSFLLHPRFQPDRHRVSRSESSLHHKLRHFPGIQIFLEPCERLPNLVGLAEVGQGVLNRALFEPKQWRELLLVQFLHTDIHIVGRYEIQEHLLPAVEVRADFHLRLRGPFLTAERRQRGFVHGRLRE